MNKSDIYVKKFDTNCSFPYVIVRQKLNLNEELFSKMEDNKILKGKIEMSDAVLAALIIGVSSVLVALITLILTREARKIKAQNSKFSYNYCKSEKNIRKISK